MEGNSSTQNTEIERFFTFLPIDSVRQNDDENDDSLCEKIFNHQGKLPVKCDLNNEISQNVRNLGLF